MPNSPKAHLSPSQDYVPCFLTTQIFIIFHDCMRFHDMCYYMTYHQISCTRIMHTHLRTFTVCNLFQTNLSRDEPNNYNLQNICAHCRICIHTHGRICIFAGHCRICSSGFQNCFALTSISSMSKSYTP